MTDLLEGFTPRVVYTDDEPETRGLRDVRAAVHARPRRSFPRWPWLIAIGFLLGLLFAETVHAAEPCVELRVRPRFMLRRGDLDLTARVRRHADHRALVVAWTSDVGSEGSSVTVLEGDRARTLVPLMLHDQPAARYVISAVVVDSAGQVLGRDRADIEAPETW